MRLAGACRHSIQEDLNYIVAVPLPTLPILSNLKHDFIVYALILLGIRILILSLRVLMSEGFVSSRLLLQGRGKGELGFLRRGTIIGD